MESLLELSGDNAVASGPRVPARKTAENRSSLCDLLSRLTQKAQKTI